MEKRRGELKGMAKKGKPQKVPALEVNWEEERVIAVAGGGGVEEDKKRKLSSFGGSVTCSSSSSSTTTSLGGSRKGVGVGGVQQPCCQAEKCTVDLTEAKRYHRRHRVCEVHSKATAVIVAGLRQRFCQQCSRFHELSEFDKSKRSCRRRLAGHNERRRKVSSDSQGEDSESTRCLQTDHSGKSQMSCLVGAPTYKDLQIK